MDGAKIEEHDGSVHAPVTGKPIKLEAVTEEEVSKLANGTLARLFRSGL